MSGAGRLPPRIIEIGIGIDRYELVFFDRINRIDRIFFGNDYDYDNDNRSANAPLTTIKTRQTYRTDRTELSRHCT